MRRCPKCGVEVEDKALHFCETQPEGFFVKIDVLKVLEWWKKRKWKIWS